MYINKDKQTTKAPPRDQTQASKVTGLEKLCIYQRGSLISSITFY